MAGFDLLAFINAIFYIYYLLIFARVIFSWFRIPNQGPVLMIFRFIYDITEPYLGIFRRIIPTTGPIDFSPFAGMLVLIIIQRIVQELVISAL